MSRKFILDEGDGIEIHVLQPDGSIEIHTAASATEAIKRRDAEKVLNNLRVIKGGRAEGSIGQ